MEKRNKPLKTTGIKRRRKGSVSTAASVPKTMKFDISDTMPSAAIIVSDQLPIATPKLSTVESIFPEAKPVTTQAPKKKKAKKTKGTPNTVNNPIASPIESGEKNGKQKKKEKQKELLAELNALKDIIMGPTQNLNKDLNFEGSLQKNKKAEAVSPNKNLGDEDKWPVLKDKELIEKFLKVPLNNNQKGRIRQGIKLSLQGSSTTMFPDIINGKIQAILKSTSDLTDSELRRVRILYNMLKTSLEKPEELEVGEKTPTKKKAKKRKAVSEDGEGKDSKEKKEKEEPAQKKVKGPKRYVVFLGNLPLDINKEKIMEHFRELNEHILDIRLPKVAEGTKSAIAYVDLTNEPSYELALSKHHSMLGTKRIKVLYTAQKNGKISNGEAKGKSAKLIALQKAGKLVGSIPTKKKRSHRRAIMKQAKAKEAADASAAV